MSELDTGSKVAVAKAVWDHVKQYQTNKDSIYLHPALELNFSNISGAGVIVTSDVEPDTILLTVPASKQIKPTNSPIKEQFTGLDPWCALVVALLYEQALGDKSQHHLFLKSLPDHFDLPMFWSVTQSIKLAGLSLPKLLDIDSDWSLKIQPWLKQNETVFESIADSKPIDFSLYKRAVALILSRGFRDHTGNPCLAPVIDYCNTTPTKVADPATCPTVNSFVCWDDETGALNLISLRPIKQSAEVLIEYGVERGNSAYLQRYGFVITGSQNLEDTCSMDCESVAAIAMEMGFTENFPREHKKPRRVFNDDDDSDDDDDDEDESDVEVESFIESLPEEKIPLTFDKAANPSLSSGLPDRLLKLSAALCGLYPTDQLVNHTDQPTAIQSLPMKLSDRVSILQSLKPSSSSIDSSIITTTPLKLSLEQESMVLELCWLGLQERLAELTLEVDESDLSLLDASLNSVVMNADVAQYDERRAAMANVLRESEKTIVGHAISQTVSRMEFLKHALKRKAGKRKNPVSLM